ncbi:MAG: tRNA dihydrouridine synthase DusB, partial [Gallionellaceae bacterium CG02_land_8_20_14_3_00_60_115]
LESAEEQLRAVNDFFAEQKTSGEKLRYDEVREKA